MSNDPLGFFARSSAARLLMTTPEYWQVRSVRSPMTVTIRSDSAYFLMKTETISVEGLKIRFARSIAPHKPTVLFLSPLPQSIYCYEAFWKNVFGEFGLVAVDLPDFGGNEGNMDLMTFSEQSAFLEKIIEQLKLIDTPIIAPDVAMPVAMHYVMHHNHCVKSIMIGDGPGVLPSADGSLIRKIVGSAFWRAMVRLNGARTLLETATQMDYLHYNITEGELNDYVQSYQGRIDQVVAYFASYPEHLKELDLKTNILKLPVHVFWGYTDASLSCENECLLDRRLQNNGLTIFENCGHFSYQDKPDEFVQMIRNWVTERHQAFASSK